MLWCKEVSESVAMRTEILPAVGSDGATYNVIRRTPSVSVRGSHGELRKDRPPRFYLDNGDILERTWDSDTLKTEDGELLLKLVKS